MIFYKDAFYISEGGELEGGRILKIQRGGNVDTIVQHLPTMGDHHTNGLVIKDDYIYFGLGTYTNSGIVGSDNRQYGWLTRHKDDHDIPCADIVLAGENYSDDSTVTGAFVPYGTKTNAGDIIKGRVPCSGAVMRVPVSGGKPELVSWGFRNPFGFALAPSGDVFITDNGYDDRGARAVWGAADVLWKLQPGSWYGWPDFSGGQPMAGRKEFSSKGKPALRALLKQYPASPPKAIAVLGVHASANGMDFSAGASFGYTGEVFIAEFGDMAPATGKVLSPVGFKVVRVNIHTGVVEDFAVNKGKRNGPALKYKNAGLERPISVRFDPQGNNLYVVDFGVVKMTKNGPEPQTGTGAIWKVSKK